MKQVCAWCLKDLGGNQENPDEPDSHGICEECMKKELAKLEKEAA